LSIELTIKPLELGGGYKYRMLDMLCVEVLEIGIVRMLLKRQQLFSTGYGVSASLNATFFALVLARFEPLLIFFFNSSGGCKG
jgi:hypothetical protein